MLHLLLAAVAVVVAAGCGWLSESCGQSDTAWGGIAGAPCTNCCLLSEYDTFLVAIEQTLLLLPWIMMRQVHQRPMGPMCNALSAQLGR